MEERNIGWLTYNIRDIGKIGLAVLVIGYLGKSYADISKGKDTIPARTLRPILNLDGDNGPFDYGRAWKDYLAAKREEWCRNLKEDPNLEEDGL